MREATAERGAVRRRRVHHGGVLVHVVDVVREPRGDARARSDDTFAGIRPADVPGFVASQLAGAAIATAMFAWLVPKKADA